MPSFEVTAASREITLDEADGRRGRVRFNVLNVAGGARTCRFIVNPAGGAEAGWFRIEGEQERTLQPNTSTDVDLAVEVPADATPGERRVRVDVAEVSAPEEDWTRGQDLRFTVPEIETEPNRFPWIPVAAAALLVLVLAGGLTWYFTRERTVELADVVGRSADEARAALEDAGFTVASEPRQTAEAPPGQVLDQRPDPGPVEPGTTVTLVVAQARPTVAVPDVIGFEQSAALRVLEESGLRPSTGSTRHNERPAGTVAALNPTAGTQVDDGSRVEVIVSSGPQNTDRRTCYNAVQGKIAWNRQGITQWADPNVERLCAGNETSTEPAECFLMAMHGLEPVAARSAGATDAEDEAASRGWIAQLGRQETQILQQRVEALQRANIPNIVELERLRAEPDEWTWEPALELCAGTPSAARTIACFAGELARGRNRQQAVDACKTN